MTHAPAQDQTVCLSTIEGNAKDLVLIYPPWPALEERAALQNFLPPLSVLSIASFVRSKGYSVGVIDVHGQHLDEGEVRARLRAARPRFVGISVLTNACVPAHRIARIVKEELPDCMVVVGGSHVEALPERSLRNSAIDIVVRGDGEDAMVEIMEGRPLSEIPGLTYRVGTEVRHNKHRPVEMNLDRFPMPAYDLVDFDFYFPAAGSYRHLPAINVLMTRGCPGRCSFCNSARTTLRSRSPDEVVKQIRHLHDTYGIRQVQFYDDTFTVMKKHCLDFCEALAAERMDVSWTAYIRGDCFSDDIAAAMKKAGCHQVLVGVETGNPEIAKKIGKPIDRERYKETVAIARRHGLEIRATFIIGHLGETWQTMKDTLDFAIELDVDLFQLNIATPYPGTQLYNEAVELGWLTSKDWYEYGQCQVLIRQPQLSPEEILKFERYAFRRFYMRPKTIWRMMKRMVSWHHLRDYYRALEALILGRKKSNVDQSWDCWRGFKEEDFFDVNLVEPEQLRLTYELRQGVG
ncbi:B12-binding domain-containing radical SAM protein [Paramagnetospirillum marisnigri]|uniref:B12-binding domain-containing radical SAM protein n=1 Tax=Paramagnetospirillum marisnigri TaxID=1285242 RepID=UPI001560639F|nr:radical SAM protein [Paramagnetospirillum marisnigri]